VLPLKLIRWPAAPSAALSGFGSIWTALYTFMIGIAFLLPLDISLSFWFFYLFTRVQDTGAMLLGFRDTGGWSANLPPYHVAQIPARVWPSRCCCSTACAARCWAVCGHHAGQPVALLGLAVSLSGSAGCAPMPASPRWWWPSCYVLYLLVAW